MKGSKAFFLSRLVCSLSTAHCNALVPTTTSSSPLAQQQEGSQLISAQIRPLAEPAGHCLDLHLMLRHASMPLLGLFVNRTGWAGSSPVFPLLVHHRPPSCLPQFHLSYMLAHPPVPAYSSRNQFWKPCGLTLCNTQIRKEDTCKERRCVL